MKTFSSILGIAITTIVLSGCSHCEQNSCDPCSQPTQACCPKPSIWSGCCEQNYQSQCCE